jgi:hypothetical protein
VVGARKPFYKSEVLGIRRGVGTLFLEGGGRWREPRRYLEILCLKKHWKTFSVLRVGYVQSSRGFRWTMALRISLVVRMPTK